ncbi:hypothetical protein [Streptomyces sp. NPDC052107]
MTVDESPAARLASQVTSKTTALQVSRQSVHEKHASRRKATGKER